MLPHTRRAAAAKYHHMPFACWILADEYSPRYHKQCHLPLATGDHRHLDGGDLLAATASIRVASKDPWTYIGVRLLTCQKQGPRSSVFSSSPIFSCETYLVCNNIEHWIQQHFIVLIGTRDTVEWRRDDDRCCSAARCCHVRTRNEHWRMSVSYTHLTLPTKRIV